LANDYDSCVAIIMANGKQLAVAWHVDDLKILSQNVHNVDTFLVQLDGELRKEMPMNKSCGKIQDYPGIMLDCSQPGCVTIYMSE
jgi:hypothetical protein